MIEYSSHRVDPANENSFLEIMTNFGWTLVDSNEVYNESTQISEINVKSYDNYLFGAFMKGFTGKDGKVEVKTQTNVTNYIVLRFSRDTDMPNYSQLKSNETKFYNYINTPEPKKPIVRTIISFVAILILILSIIGTINEPIEPMDIVIIVLIVLGAPSLLIFSWKWYSNKKKYYEDCISKATEIYSESEKLLNEK